MENKTFIRLVDSLDIHLINTALIRRVVQRRVGEFSYIILNFAGPLPTKAASDSNNTVLVYGKGESEIRDEVLDYIFTELSGQSLFSNE